MHWTLNGVLFASRFAVYAGRKGIDSFSASRQDRLSSTTTTPPHDSVRAPDVVGDLDVDRVGGV